MLAYALAGLGQYGYDHSLGLLAVPRATSLTVTVPKDVPKMSDTSPEFNTEASAL